ncbi:Csu type fimbrial protein [Radicibacter daui]|uniref:Csu type fimbrial protein n=1 Tax=Radicibacter daui TaxID=3064829 RepID=UPI004046C4E9
MTCRARRFLAAIAAAFLLGAHPALAAVCSATSTPLAFGIYRPFDMTATYSNATVTVHCTSLVTLLLTFNVSLSSGSAGSYSSRQMRNGSASLGYNLYLSNQYSSVWGDGTGGTANVGFSSLVTIFPFDIVYTMYGRIPAQQPVRAGAYIDTVQIVITY